MAGTPGVALLAAGDPDRDEKYQDLPVFLKASPSWAKTEQAVWSAIFRMAEEATV
jgi:hypothetical protein